MVEFIKAMGTKPVRISYFSPWQNGTAERWIGSWICLVLALAAATLSRRRFSMSYQTAGRKQPSEPKASRPHVPGYGIPKTPKGMLPWSFVDERMRKSLNYWICTTCADGRPHARPVWGVWVDGAFCFGGHGVLWDRTWRQILP